MAFPSGSVTTFTRVIYYSATINVLFFLDFCTKLYDATNRKNFSNLFRKVNRFNECFANSFMVQILTSCIRLCGSIYVLAFVSKFFGFLIDSYRTKRNHNVVEYQRKPNSADILHTIIGLHNVRFIHGDVLCE